MISLTDFFDAASRRHNNVILLPYTECLVTTLFQQVSAPAHGAGAHATVELFAASA